MPKISLNSAFKKFNVIQFAVAFGLFGYYASELRRLKGYIPE